MKFKILCLVGLVLLGGCNQPLNNVDAFVQKELNLDAPPANISKDQLTQLILTLYPQAKIKENSEGKTKTTTLVVSENETISVVSLGKRDWDFVAINFSSDTIPYNRAKEFLMTTCRGLWAKIDSRVPNVLTELDNRLNENETSQPMTQHIRFGYDFTIDARHYQSAYPMYCRVAVN